MRSAHDLSMRHFAFAGLVGQWDLLAVALHCLRELTKRPRVVVDSSKACNPKPSCRVDLAGWLKKAEWALVGGAKCETEGTVTPLMLLLGWCTSLTDEGRTATTGVVGRGAGWADLAMVVELVGHLELSPATLTKQVACCFVEEADPSHHDVEVAPPGRGTQATADVDSDAGLDAGLTSCQLQPAGLTGEELSKRVACHRDRRKQRLQTAFRRPAVDTLDWPWAAAWNGATAGAASCATSCGRSSRRTMTSPRAPFCGGGAALGERADSQADARRRERGRRALGPDQHARADRKADRGDGAGRDSGPGPRTAASRQGPREQAGKDELRAKAARGLAGLRVAATVDPSEAGLTVDEMHGVGLVHLCRNVEEASKQVVVDAFDEAVREGALELPAAAAPWLSQAHAHRTHEHPSSSSSTATHTHGCMHCALRRAFAKSRDAPQGAVARREKKHEKRHGSHPLGPGRTQRRSATVPVSGFATVQVHFRSRGRPPFAEST